MLVAPCVCKLSSEGMKFGCMHALMHVCDCVCVLVRANSFPNRAMNRHCRTFDDHIVQACSHHTTPYRDLPERVTGEACNLPGKRRDLCKGSAQEQCMGGVVLAFRSRQGEGTSRCKLRKPEIKQTKAMRSVTCLCFRQRYAGRFTFMMLGCDSLENVMRPLSSFIL